MSKKIQISAALLGILVTTAIVAGAAYASPEDGFFKRGGHMGNSMHNNADREQVKLALDNNDYTSWLEAVGADSEIAGIINTDNFSQLVKAHNLMQEAKSKMDEAKAIFEELGIERPGKGNKQGPKYTSLDWQASRDAIDEGNYSAWLEAVGPNSKIAEFINTNEKFLKLVEAHNLMKDGDYEGAKEIREELGLDTGRGLKGEKQGRKGGNNGRGMYRSVK